MLENFSERDAFQVNEVFTPAQPARVTFVDRVAVNDKLVDALKTPGMQLVVFGHSGTGKTTLLTNKISQLYSNHITTRCMKGLRFSQIVDQAFQDIGKLCVTEGTISKKNSVGFEAGIGVGSKVVSDYSSEVVEKVAPVSPIKNTPQTLGRFLGEAGACWVLEDFHKIDPDEKTYLSQMMKIFMDMADDYPDLKIIAIGAVDTGRQVVEYDPEMRSRVAEIRVDLMTDEEIDSIIEKGEKALNVEIPSYLKNTIKAYANGLPATCHQICLDMCRSAGVDSTSPCKLQIKKENFDYALTCYVDKCSDFIKDVFDNALKSRQESKYQQPGLVLYALTYFDVDGASRRDILDRIRLTTPSFPDQSLKTLLQKLVSQDFGEILRFDENSAKYSFSDPVYKAYAMARLKREGRGVRKGGGINVIEVRQELLDFLKNKNL